MGNQTTEELKLETSPYSDPIEDFDDMLNEIASEIDEEYTNNAHVIDNISKIFTYKKQLGHGASSKVLLAKHNETGKQYALKIMNKSDQLNDLLFTNEQKILNILSKHQNIVSYHSSFIDKNYYYLSTTYCSGGTMRDRILNQGYFSEFECAEFIKNVLFGIQHMHHNNIVHRDIKLENLLFDKKNNEAIVKIIDFGNSEIINNPKQTDKVFIGSLHYLPPEMLSSQIRKKQILYKSDMWSVGVVSYMLLCCKAPFHGNNQSETINAIKIGKLEWPQYVNLSDSCKNFISSLLCIDINKRLNCDEALKHEWISKKGKASDRYFDDAYLNQIGLFSVTNKLQRLLINGILSEMDAMNKKMLLKAIRDLDMNGTRKINKNDITNYILTNGKINNEENNQKKSQNLSMSLNEMEIDNILEEIELIDNVNNNMKGLKIINEEKAEIIDKNESLLKSESIMTEKKISIERFNMIMNCVEKQYDVKLLVNKLKPTDSGNIALRNINMFNDISIPLHTDNDYGDDDGLIILNDNY